LYSNVPCVSCVSALRLLGRFISARAGTAQVSQQALHAPFCPCWFSPCVHYCSTHHVNAVCFFVCGFFLCFAAYGFGLFAGNGADFNRQIAFGHSTTVKVTQGFLVEWRFDYVEEYLFAQRVYLRDKRPVSDDKLVNEGYYMTANERKCIVRLEEELKQAKDQGLPYPCVIIESVQSCGKGALGILFARALARVCHETRTPLVSDCIMTAVRAGAAMLCFEFLGFSPDIVVVGKAIPGAAVLLVHHHSAGSSNNYRPRLLLSSKTLPPSPNTTIKLSQHQYASMLFRMHRYKQPGFLANIVDMGVLLRNAMVDNCAACMENTSKCALGVGLLICANRLMIRKSVSFEHERLLPKLDITPQIIQRYVSPSNVCLHMSQQTTKAQKKARKR